MNVRFNLFVRDSGVWLKNFVWRRQFFYGVLLTGILSLVVFQLSLIPINSAQEEVSYITTNSQFEFIGDNPLNLPHKLATFSVRQFTESVRFIRAISIVFFGLCVVALYRILKRWHSDKVALFGATMFATNAIVLAIARLATPTVLLFGWAIVIALLLWLLHGSSRRFAPLTLALLATALLYVPGAPYFFVLLVILFFNKITTTLKSLPNSAIGISSVLVVAVLSPLVVSFIQQPELLKAWLLLPENIIWSEIPKNMIGVPSAFVYRTPVEPLINVGRLPLFDVASGGLFLIGLYAYQKYIKLERTKIMLLTALLGFIVGALGQIWLAVIIVLPFVYSVIGAGISYILDMWYRVFPKNPFARSFGLLLVTLVVLFSVYYQLTRFLVVWVNTPETRGTYNQSRIVQ